MIIPDKFYNLYLLLAILLAISGLFVPLMDNDAAHHANIALRMYLTGDYVTLADHAGDYLDKPHLHFWLAAGSYHLFGVNEFAYKLPSLLFSILGVYSTYKLGSLLYNQQTGKLAALILVTSFSFFLAMNDVRMDAILTACIIFTTWQGIAWVNKKNLSSILLLALGAALGFCTKGHIALFVPALSIFLYILYKKNWPTFYHWHILIFCVAFLIFISPVLYSYYLQFDLHPEKVIRGESGRSGVAFILWNQNIERLSGEKFSSKASGDRLFFFHTYLWAFAPWSIIAYIALFTRLKNIRHKKYEWVTAGTILLFSILITFAGFKLPHYLNVILPVSSLLVAAFLINNSQRPWMKYLLITQYIVCALALVLLIFINFWAFTPVNYWVTAGFILLLLLSIYIIIHQKQPLQKLITVSVLGFFMIFYLFNLNFYPALLKYQAGNELAVLTNKKINASNVFYWPGVYSSSYDFYSAELRKEYDSTRTRLPSPAWIMIHRTNLEKFTKSGLPVYEITAHPDYEITRLKMSFINPRTRKDKLNELLLIRVN